MNEGSSLVYQGEEIFTTIRPDIITPNITLIDVEVEPTERQWTTQSIDPTRQSVSTTREIVSRTRGRTQMGESSSNFENFRGQTYATMKEIPKEMGVSTTTTSSYRTSNYRPSTTARLTSTTTVLQHIIGSYPPIKMQEFRETVL